MILGFSLNIEDWQLVLLGFGLPWSFAFFYTMYRFATKGSGRRGLP